MKLLKLVYVGVVSIFTLNNSLHAQDKPFQKEINEFIKQDKLKPPPPNAILFVGSSSFRMWDNIESYFPDKTIINRGFGGSSLTDLIEYADDIIYPYKPAQIVIYCGENDIAGGADAELTVKRFKTIFEMIRGQMPAVPIVYVSIKPSPSRKEMRASMDSANKMIRQYLRGQRRTDFVDVYSLMLNKNKQAKPEIFLSDSLHMNENGYRIWQKAITPHLIKK